MPHGCLHLEVTWLCSQLNMSNFIPFVKREPVIAAMIFAPLLLFLLLILSPALDSSFQFDAQFQKYVHYYATAFSGFVALIIALYSSGVFGQSVRARMQFITMAFGVLGGLLLLSGLATPGIIFREPGIQASSWSLNLSLPAGAMFCALAAIRWRPAAEALLVRWRGRLGAAVVVLFGLYLWLVTAVPQPFLTFSVHPFSGPAGFVLAFVTVGLYLWSALRIRVDFEARSTFSQRLSVALLLLAEAQIFLRVGRPEALSSLIFYPLLLLAVLVAVWAILATLRSTEELQVARYFAVAGSVLIVGFSLLAGEFIINVFDLYDYRPTILLTLIVQGVLDFLILYVIVVHLDHLVRARTADFRREQRLRSELTQMVIHDLKSPLTVIRSSISMFLKGHLGETSPQQQRILVRADESSQRILQLIDNLLDVERLEAGVLVLQPRSIQSANWLRESLANWELVAEAQGKRLHVCIPEALPSLFGDRELLQRVLNNLLTNALKYSSPEGTVEVIASAESSIVVIKVIDDGPGVPDSDKLRIFEKFAQVEGTERRGTGLGLTFCKMVVEAHGGMLVVGDNPTGGAVFRLALPTNQYSVTYGEIKARQGMRIA